MTPAAPPTFEVVPSAEAQRRRPTRRPRRDWKPVVDALVAGRSLFMSDENITESNVKYLTLCLYRRGKGEKLRTTRTIRGETEGRLLWVVTGMDEAPTVGAEV